MFHSHNQKMLANFRVKKAVIAMSGAILSAAGATNVLAQEGSTSPQLEEVIVTGTLIRGVDPVGAKVIGLDAEAIIDSGASTTNEILATIPQVANYFNERPEQDPRGLAITVINRPNLRDLPGFTSASGSTTLVMVDGHRVAPLGINQSSLDPDVIPAAVIERIEVVTDGGSSLYGADAVGGVVNFITRKEFEGVKVDLNYGSGDDFDTTDISITGGTNWEGGSLILSMSHSERENMQEKDRDWAQRGIQTENGVMPNGTRCIEPVGSITSWASYGRGWTDNPRAASLGVKVTPVGDACDISGEDSLLPEANRDNFWGSISHELTDNVSFSMQAYYAERDTALTKYPLGAEIVEPNPRDLEVPPGPVGATYDVAALGFSYGAHPGYVNRGGVQIDWETYGFSPELVITMDNGWQLRQTVHYGHSETSLLDPQSNTPKMLNYNASGQFDPNNVAATDAAVLDDILDLELAGQTIQELFLARMVADGALMNLPAGAMRMAAGVEFSEDRARKRLTEVPMGGLGAVDYKENSRDIKSFFAEVQVPVFDALDLSFSVRQDDYSDFGKTSNPNVGFTFAPADWISVFGHWGESFNAPTAVDDLNEGRIRNYTCGGRAGSVIPTPPNVDGPTIWPDDRPCVLHLVDGGAKLKPQVAETWAVGFELEPLEGLQIGATFFDIEFDQILGSVNPQILAAVLANPEKFVFANNPDGSPRITQELLDEYLGSVNNADLYPQVSIESTGIILDRRVSNTEAAKLEGFDFFVSYTHNTSIGTMSYGLNGNHQSTFDIITAAGTTDNLDQDVPDLNIAGNIAWSRNNVRARLNLKYTNGFEIDGELDQTSVDDYLVADLFVGYDFKQGNGFADGLSLRFNIDNVFDEDPPVWRRSSPGLPYSGFTLGRVFKFGISKKF